MRLPITLAALIALSLPAIAQEQCAPYAAISSKLLSRYGEAPLWRGVTEDGAAAIELTVNASTGTWTVLRLEPNGSACMLLEGAGWAFGEAPKVGAPL